MRTTTKVTKFGYTNCGVLQCCLTGFILFNSHILHLTPSLAQDTTAKALDGYIDPDSSSHYHVVSAQNIMSVQMTIFSVVLVQQLALQCVATDMHIEVQIIYIVVLTSSEWVWDCDKDCRRRDPVRYYTCLYT